MALRPLEIPPAQATRPRPFTKLYTLDVPRRLRFTFNSRSDAREGGAWFISLLTRGTLSGPDDYILPEVLLRPSADLFADFRSTGDDRIPPRALVITRSDGLDTPIGRFELGTVARMSYDDP